MSINKQCNPSMEFYFVRFIAFLIDGVVIYVLWYMTILLVHIGFHPKWDIADIGLAYWWGVFLTMIYFAFFYHKAMGQTIGNRIFRLRIVRYKDFKGGEEKPLSILESFGRSYILSFILFLFGFPWPIQVILGMNILVDIIIGVIGENRKMQRMGWDIFSNSVVLRKEVK